MNILWQVFYKVSAFVNSPEFLRSFFDNRFYLILLVIILMRFKYATYSSMWMSALVNIPGTFLHELMHYLVGSLLNARPVNFTIFPQRNLDGDYVMGASVSAISPFIMRFLRRWRRFCCCQSLFTLTVMLCR